MDKGKAYSVLITWADFLDNPARAKWCRTEMEKLLLKDLGESIAFIKVQKDHVYLDLLSNLLPELAYQYQSWDLIDEMEKMKDYHHSETWQNNLDLAKKKIKQPSPHHTVENYNY